jgi:hypothetical protein
VAFFPSNVREARSRPVREATPYTRLIYFEAEALTPIAADGELQIRDMNGNDDPGSDNIIILYCPVASWLIELEAGGHGTLEISVSANGGDFSVLDPILLHDGVNAASNYYLPGLVAQMRIINGSATATLDAKGAITLRSGL